MTFDLGLGHSTVLDYKQAGLFWLWLILHPLLLAGVIWGAFLTGGWLWYQLMGLKHRHDLDHGHEIQPISNLIHLGFFLMNVVASLGLGILVTGVGLKWLLAIFRR